MCKKIAIFQVKGWLLQTALLVLLEQLLGVKIHEDTCTVKHEISMPLIILMVMYCLKKVKGETMITVMMSAILLRKIVGDFMISRNFKLHCHFLK